MKRRLEIQVFCDVRLRVQCRQFQVPTPIPRIGVDLTAACRQVGIVGWRPISGSRINPLTLELNIYSLAHYLCKVGIFHEPRRVTLGNT